MLRAENAGLVKRALVFYCYIGVGSTNVNERRDAYQLLSYSYMWNTDGILNMLACLFFCVCTRCYYVSRLSITSTLNLIYYAIFRSDWTTTMGRLLGRYESIFYKVNYDTLLSCRNRTDSRQSCDCQLRFLSTELHAASWDDSVKYLSQEHISALCTAWTSN